MEKDRARKTGAVPRTNRGCRNNERGPRQQQVCHGAENGRGMRSGEGEYSLWRAQYRAFCLGRVVGCTRWPPLGVPRCSQRGQGIIRPSELSGSSSYALRADSALSASSSSLSYFCRNFASANTSCACPRSGHPSHRCLLPKHPHRHRLPMPRTKPRKTRTKLEGPRELWSHHSGRAELLAQPPFTVDQCGNTQLWISGAIHDHQGEPARGRNQNLPGPAPTLPHPVLHPELDTVRWRTSVTR